MNLRQNLFARAPLIALIALSGCKGTPDSDSDVTIIDLDGDGFEAAVDCDDGDVTLHPQADELCNHVDDDCDGEIDEDAVDGFTGYHDNDDDNFGTGPSLIVCTSDHLGMWKDDCDDEDADVHPRADELCNHVDDDCNGEVDDYPVDAPAWHWDSDGDGFGTDFSGILDCKRPSGMIADDSDCDDYDAKVNPDADEVCDGLDNDCTWGVDVNAIDARSEWPDADGDGFGDTTATSKVRCPAVGFVVDSTDCDDGAVAVNPAATELCNGWDDDCDGLLDRDDPSNAGDATWYEDADSDGFGGASVLACAPPQGWIGVEGDCDDANANIRPTSPEICNNGVDDNCDGGAGACHPTGTVPVGTSLAKWTSSGAIGIGTALALLGDTDGDGHADLAIGTGRSAMRAYIVSLNSGSGPIDNAASATFKSTINSAYGHAVAGGADLDGDLTLDLVVADTAGHTYLYSANTSGIFDAHAAAFASLHGETGNEKAGMAVALAGDGDTDGFDDLAIGAPLDSSAASIAGAVYIVGGGPTLVGDLSLASARAKVVGGVASDGLGAAVAGRGDHDGDGVPDIAIGAPNSGGHDGSVGIVAGDLSGTSSVVDGIVLVGNGGEFGSTVAFVHDPDGDGYDDLVVGASEADTAYLFTGPIADGSYTNATSSFRGAADSGLGASIAGGGDFDGDGHDDLALGAVRSINEGSVWLVYGPLPIGAVPLAAPFAAEFTWSGHAFGATVLFSDVDSDGRDDLIVGTPYAGDVRVLPGTDL